MGEVYRALDTKLRRQVALKVLPEAFAGDADRMMRFQREAEVLASLNHLNIAHIYGVEERALVMELVEGESPKGPLDWEDAWKIASQIADALAYAHDKGVVHRDLKPANIKVTVDGVVKLLDFGLAKALSGTTDARPYDPGNSPTVTMGGTMAGVILGTAAYMSPEQARGKAVDKRADISAFGVVLYELLTGKQLFGGEDTAETLGAVIHKAPDLSAVPEKTRPLLEACLEKDPKTRLRDIGDIWRLLAQPAAPAPVRSRFSWGWVVAGILGGAAVAVSLIHFHETPPVAEALKLSVTLPAAGIRPAFLALSPDGRRLVVRMRAQGKDALWMRPMDSDGFRVLEGTVVARVPFWSSDSRFLGFFVDGKLKIMPAAGGLATTLCEGIGLGRGGTWNRAGVILFSSENFKLWHVNAAGGACTALSLGDNGWRAVHPEFLPDGDHFVFAGDLRGDFGLFLASLDGMKPRKILNAASNALYSEPASGKGPAHLLFLRGTDLMAQPFDAYRLEAAGEPFLVAREAAPLHSQHRESVAGGLEIQFGPANGSVCRLQRYLDLPR